MNGVWRYCYHPEDHFPITAGPVLCFIPLIQQEICQRLKLKFIKRMIHQISHSFVVTLNAAEAS